MKYRHNTAQDQPKCKRYDDTYDALIHMRTLAQPIRTAADSPTANEWQGHDERPQKQPGEMVQHGSGGINRC